MEHYKFAGFNKEMLLPRQWNMDIPCVSLPVMEGNGMHVSGWRPSFRERVQILFGANVFVHIVGGQPPVALTVQRIKEVQ